MTIVTWQNDWLTIGRVVPQQQPEPKVVVKEKIVYRDRPVKSNKPKSQPKPKQQETDQFYNECVNALVSLGEKKGRARQVTAKVFHMGRPASMDEFITRVFKQ